MSSPEAKAWASGTHRKRWNPSMNIHGNKPRSPCPSCYADGVTSDRGALLEFRCPRGHTWTKTRREAETHGYWVERLFFTSETQHSRQT